MTILAWCSLNIHPIQPKQEICRAIQFLSGFSVSIKISYFNILHRWSDGNPLASSDLSSHDFTTLVERKMVAFWILGERGRRKKSCWEEEVLKEEKEEEGEEEEGCRRVGRQHCGEIPSGIVCGNAHQDVYGSGRRGTRLSAAAEGSEVANRHRGKGTKCVRRSYTRRIYTTHYGHVVDLPARFSVGDAETKERVVMPMMLVMLHVLSPANCMLRCTPSRLFLLRSDIFCQSLSYGWLFELLRLTYFSNRMFSLTHLLAGVVDYTGIVVEELSRLEISCTAKVRFATERSRSRLNALHPYEVSCLINSWNKTS